MIEIGEDGRSWLLSGPTSSYALRLTDLDELLHLHWGHGSPSRTPNRWPPCPARRTDPSSPASTGARSIPSRAAPLRTSGAVRADAGAARHRMAFRGVRGRRRRTAAALRGRRARHHLALPDARRRRRALGDPGQRRTFLELLRADSATWTLPERDGWRLSQLHGRWAAESRLARSPSPTVRRSSAAAAGTPVTSTCRGSRWTAGRVRRAARSTRARSAGRARGASAWPNSPTRACRSPAARGTTTPDCCVWSRGVVHHPVFAGLWSDGGFGAASRTWHAYQRAFVIPDADQDRPVLFNSWEATHFDISEERQRELARRAAEMGVELFVVDDGWFGARTSDRAGLGDWTPIRTASRRAEAARRRRARARHAVRDLGRAGDGESGQ